MGTTTNHVCSENFFKQMLISRSAFQTHVSLDKSKGNKIIKSNTVITIKQYANYALKISV
jgi:hypothetical protein